MAFPQPSFEKLQAVSKLRPGDIVKTREGKTYEFERVLQKAFVGKSTEDGKPWRVAIEAFEAVVGKAAPKPVERQKIDNSWQDLKPGDLFYIEYKGRLEIYRFDHLTPTPKIVAKHPTKPDGKITIPTSLYGGRLGDLK